MNIVLVTGGAGFIGSHLVDKLLEKGYVVKILDNFTSGSYENIRDAVEKGAVVIKGDLKNPEDIARALKDVDTVFHFAANPEVRVSTTKPVIHFRENVIATFNLLEEIRRYGGVEKLVFASSSTVYGDAEIIPTPENHPFKPISVYGASKAACEALLSSYAYLYGFKSVALRYANIVGPRLNHGVIYDFLVKLHRNPRVLEVLGDGTQRKSYLYITDAVDATFFITERMEGFYNAYNVGNTDWITVREIAEIVIKVTGLNAEIRYTGGTRDGRGWPGDVKYMRLSIEKLRSMGWSPKYTSREAVEKTAQALYPVVFGRKQIP